MKPAKEVKDDDFLPLLETGIRDILKDADADVKDKLKAIEIGAKLAAIRHNIDDDTKGNFFK